MIACFKMNRIFYSLFIFSTTMRIISKVMLKPLGDNDHRHRHLIMLPLLNYFYMKFIRGTRCVKRCY